MNDNGTANGTSPVRIRFATKFEWQDLDPEVASKMFILWHDRNPAQFGAYLAEVMTGTRPARSRAQS